MAVGNQATVAQVNQILSTQALQLRTLMQSIRDFQQFVNFLGLTGLENLGGLGLGFSAADAATVQQLIGYMNTVSGVYFGTVQQGGSGGTGATQFNFDNALTSLWGGQ